MLLVGEVELVKVAAPAPYANDEVRIIFGMLLSIEKALAVDGIELKLMTAEPDKALYELCRLFDTLVVSEDGVVKLKG